MRAVLYTVDMEPITVLQLGDSQAQCLIDRQRVSVPVMLPLSLEVSTDPVRGLMYRQVDIWAEELIRGRHRSLMLFTHDETAALMLRSVLLPGQRKDAHERDRQKYASGFLDGLNVVLGGR